MKGNKGKDGGMSRSEVEVGGRRNKGKRTGECGASGAEKWGAKGPKRNLKYTLHFGLYVLL